MAIRLYSEFKSDNGTQYKIEIHDANWLAAATTFNVDSKGFDLIYEGETDDIVSPVVSSRLTFGAYSENATFETFINTLKTFQESRFQLAVRKYNGASYDLYWAGWITQDLVSVEDESQPYIYEITATDGIGRLSNINYTTANTISQANGFKATDIIAILKTAFVNVGTSDLWGAGDAFFETSIDWWETNYQTYATSTDPISQHAVDVRLFNEFDDDGNVVYSSTLDILRQIATLYNGRFYMQNGRFVFEQYGNRDTASRYVSRYTKSGTHLGRVLVSDDKTIDQTANAARRSGNAWDFLPATQTAKVHYVQKFLNPFNAFGLFRFRNSTNAYTAGFIAGGSGIQLSIGSTSFNFKVTGSASLTSPIFPVFKMRIRIQDSSTGTYYYYNRSYNGVAAGGAMFGTPAWSTTSGFYYFDLPPFFTSGAAVVNQPVSIITDDMPVNGELDLQLTLHGVFRSKNGTTYTPSTTPLFDSIFVFGIQTNGSANAPGATFSSNNTTTGIDSKLTLDLGDLFIADGPRQTGHLAVFTGADWVGTSDWRKGSSGASLPILKLLTNETLALHVNPIEQYNGNVITSTLFGQRLVFNSAAYLMTGGTFNASSDEWSGTWYKIESVRANVTALTPVSDLVQKATIATATTSGSSSNDIIGGRIGGMVVDIEDQKIGPFQQTASGARLVGNTEITGTLDVDGAAQFNNDVNITGSVTSTGPLTGEYVQLDTTYNTTPVQGQIVWSQDDGTIDVGLNSNVTMQVGQEQFWYVKNQTGSTIPKGTAVRAAGTLGASGRILGAPMVADGSVPARFFLGIAAEDILNGGDGYVTTFGKIRQLNTSAFTEGSVLWCNPAVAGGLTATEPSAPNLKLAVAFVVRSDASSGVLAVRSETGSRVSDASDVQVTSVADNDLLQYNTATSRWENVAGTTTNIAEGTNLYYTDARSRAAISETIDGVSYNNTTGVFSLDAGRVIVTTTQTSEWDTAYNDRIVSAAVTGTTSKTLTLTQGDGGTITATWSDYDTAPVTSVNGLTGAVVLTTTNIGEGTNLYYTDARARAALSAGVGISYNNGTGVITNSAPDQVVALTAGTGISVTGTYPNFTITNTSPSSGGTITGGGTTNYLSKWTGATALGDSLVFDNGTNVGIGTATPSARLHVSGRIMASGSGYVTNPTAPIFGQYTADRGYVQVPSNGRFEIWNGGTYEIATFYENLNSIFHGNVGIGTTSPVYRLDVNGNQGVRGTTDYLGTLNGTAIAIDHPGIQTWRIGVNNSNTTTFSIGNDNGGSFATKVLNITNAGNVGIGTTNPVLFSTGWGRVLGVAASSGYSVVQVAGSSGNGGEIDFGGGSIRHAAIASLVNSNLAFFTNGTNSGDSLTERMRITLSGNVGIGTTAPSQKLDVNGNARVTSTMFFGANAQSYIGYVDADSYYRANGVHYFEGDGSYKGVWTADGKLGIGTTAPAEKLHVNGFVRLVNSGFAGIEYHNTNGTWETYVGTENAGGGSRYNSASSQHTFYNNGSAVLRINSSGNVGIGTTAPSSKLHVRVADGTNDAITIDSPSTNNIVIGGLATGVTYIRSFEGSFEIGNSFSGGDLRLKAGNAERMRITSDGAVGIGTTSPINKLDIVGGALRVVNSLAGGEILAKLLAYTPAPFGLVIRGENTGATTIQVQRESNNAEVFALTLQPSGGNVGIGTTVPGAKLDVNGGSNTEMRLTTSGSGILQIGQFTNGAYIGTTSSDATAGALRFGTNGAERMRVDINGNLGIGTTSPIDKLQVNGSLFVFGKIYNGSSNDSAGITFPNSTTRIDGFNGITFHASSTNVGSQSERMRITSAGNVGIGTTSPSYKLDVNGSFRVDGTNGDFIVDANGNDFYFTRNGANYFYGTQASSSFAFYTNSNLGLFQSSAGNVGIGTTSPAYKLDVAGDVQVQSSYFLRFANEWGIQQTGTNLNFAEIGSADGRLYLKAGGNVGIGTTSPSERLHVSSGQIRIGDSSSNFFGIRLSRTNTSVVQDAHLYSPSNNSPSVFYIEGGYYSGEAAGTVTAANSGYAYYERYFGNGATSSYKHLGFINVANGNFTSTNLIPSIALLSNGNVGIGTTSPSEKLHVDGSVVVTYNNSYQGINSIGNKAILARVSPTTGIINYAEYATATNLNGFVMGSTATQLKGIFATNKLEFTTNSSTRMTITSAGLVGIGTTSPTNILHITDVMRMDNVSAYSPNLTSDSFAKHGYGDVSNDRYLAEPAVWFKINVDGTEYVIPGYTEVI